jgi:hypothetical protein
MEERKLKIATWNANGLLGKLQDLKVFLKMHDTDILTISETKLLNSDNVKIEGYNILRKQRDTNTRGGGVAIILKTDIPFTIVRLPATVFECTAIKLAHNDITVISIYNRPLNKFRQTDLDLILNSSNNVIIAGDINARHIDWGNSYNNTNGITLKNYIDNHAVTINHPMTHTHFPANNNNPSTIDFFLLKNVTNYTQAITIPALKSDHNPVKFSIDDIPRENLMKSFTSYKHTNWKKLRHTLDNKIIINSNINTSTELDAEINKLTQALLHAKKLHSQTISTKTPRTQIPPEIINLTKDRNKYRKLHQRTGLLAYKNLTQDLNRDIKNKIITYNNNQWETLLKNASTKNNSLWKLTRARTKKRSEIPPLTNINNVEAITNKQKAESFAEYFQSIHNYNNDNDTQQVRIENEIDRLTKQPTTTDPEYIKKTQTNPHEIGTILHKLKNNKAAGDDQIDNLLIKNISRKAKVQLSHIINAALKLNYFPSQYKTATVVPILKPGKNNNKTENYRPISLLSTISKIFEKIIHRRLTRMLNELNINQEYQFGFKSRHSTTHQLARISNDILINFNKDKHTALTLLDLEKAFDRVWIKGLLYKMHQAGLNINFIKLMSSYLTSRRIKVKVNNEISNEKLINAGVPQGSVLGPTLFNLYIHDMPQFAKTNLALYADDTAIYAHSFFAQAALLQNRLHLKILSGYFEKWKLKLNETKTETIIFSRKRTNNKIFTPIKINNHTVTPAKTVKYLGVTLDTRLNFKENVKQKLNKANNAIRMIYPLIKRNSKLNANNKIIIYKTLIRPIITYAAPIWSHMSNYALQPLEVFQNKCLRMIHNAPRHTNTRHLRNISNLPTIKEYILNITSKFFNKNINHLIKTPDDNDLPLLKINRFKHKLIHQHI